MNENGRSRVPLVIAAAVGVLLVALVRNAVVGGGTKAKEPTAGRGPCVTVAIAASPEKSALINQIAGGYARTGPTVAGRCVTIDVAAKSSGGGAEALARGWDDTIDGPRPDVWSPASSSWTVIVRQRTAAADKPDLIPSTFQRIATTPLVIAMPRPMAEALGWPDKRLGWSDIFDLATDASGWGSVGHPEWGRFRLGKTNPNFSTSGLNATIGAYFAATGLSSDLSVKDVRRPKVQAFVKSVESSVVHYGDTTLTFLGNLQKADDRGTGLAYISAVTVEEKSVWDYNMGNPSGDPATLGKHARPATPLAAIYPKEGTLLSDNPYVVLDAPWVDDATKAAANDFLAFLQRPEQQQVFLAAAFRDFRGTGGSVITEQNGMLAPEPRNVLSPPAPPVLDEVQRSWEQLRKGARVLMVIDVSGSMGEAVPSAGETKLELAKRAAIRALDQFSPDDELGLWIFSSEFPNTRNPYLEIMRMQRVGGALRDFKRTISSLTPEGGTALYATTRAAVREVRDSFDRSRINAVVLLTDGKNEYPPDSNLNSLLDELQAEGEDVAVRVFPIAYGENADLETLRQIADATRAAVYNASDPASIDKVFTAVISNF